MNQHWTQTPEARAKMSRAARLRALRIHPGEVTIRSTASGRVWKGEIVAVFRARDGGRWMLIKGIEVQHVSWQ